MTNEKKYQSVEAIFSYKLDGDNKVRNITVSNNFKEPVGRDEALVTLAAMAGVELRNNHDVIPGMVVLEPFDLYELD